MNLKYILLFVSMISIGEMMAQSTGTLQITTTTSNAGGNYAPRNIVAVWVETENGQFVKTLVAYANSRKTHLNTWESSTTKAGSAYNTVDAVTGATRSSHGTINCSWNGTDYKRNKVEDGTYKLRFELTDKNSTGNFASFPFSKSNIPQKQTPANVPSFASTSILWTPSVPNGLEAMSQQKEVEINWEPSSCQLSVPGDNVKYLEIYNLAGQLVLKNQSSFANLTNFQNGAYIIVVKTNNGNFSKKIIKGGN